MHFVGKITITFFEPLTVCNIGFHVLAASYVETLSSGKKVCVHFRGESHRQERIPLGFRKV
jgi:hypothetical protein